MSLNLVTITVAVQSGPIDSSTAEGNFVFSPNGTMWPITAGALPIDPQVQTGTLVAGTASVQLVASDNFATGVLYWDTIINIRGMPTVNFTALPIIFATGASQSIWDILQFNGWQPVVQM